MKNKRINKKVANICLRASGFFADTLANAQKPDARKQ